MIRIGIDLGGTKIEGIALDAAGRSLWRERVPAPQSDYRLTLDALAALVRALERSWAIAAAWAWARRARPRRCRGACATAIPPGSTASGCARTCARAGARGALANDADCFALSEATDGAAAGAATVFGVILGTGVGGGIVLAAGCSRGPNAIAGEWGHNLFGGPRGGLAAGRACYCGRSDCVETWLSGAGLLRTYREIGGGVRMNADPQNPGDPPP